MVWAGLQLQQGRTAGWPAPGAALPAGSSAGTVECAPAVASSPAIAPGPASVRRLVQGGHPPRFS
eukprot:748495-Lingulodinium_polyedra.AAC.1